MSATLSDVESKQRPNAEETVTPKNEVGQCLKVVNDQGFVPDLCVLPFGHEGPCKHTAPESAPSAGAQELALIDKLVIDRERLSAQAATLRADTDSFKEVTKGLKAAAQKLRAALAPTEPPGPSCHVCSEPTTRYFRCGSCQATTEATQPQDWKSVELDAKQIKTIEEVYAATQPQLSAQEPRCPKCSQSKLEIVERGVGITTICSFCKTRFFVYDLTDFAQFFSGLSVQEAARNELLAAADDVTECHDRIGNNSSVIKRLGECAAKLRAAMEKP